MIAGMEMELSVAGGIEVICKVGCFSRKVVTFSKMPSSAGLNY